MNLDRRLEWDFGPPWSGHICGIQKCALAGKSAPRGVASGGGEVGGGAFIAAVAVAQSTNIIFAAKEARGANGGISPRMQRIILSLYTPSR